MPKVWQLLETIPGPAAVPAVWKSSLGTDFDGFRDSFLRHLSAPAKSFPCPRECGCAHAIVRHKDGSIVAVCRCEPSHCDDIRLTDADVAVLELNWVKLGRAIAHAFGLTRRETETGVPRVQIFFRHRIQNSNGTRMACNLASGVDARPYASDGMFGRFIERTIQVSPGP
ncbi:MAG TPA: hypothetical protein PK572_01675 [Kiritimatiellia bacterium]|nr:hypothetical protein [Kiritimatiellia bacterium]